MTPHLDNISIELLENVVVLLGLDDICNLRRTCKLLAVKIAYGHFKSYFRTKHVDMTEHALIELQYMTEPGRLGLLVENLVLVGIVNNVMEPRQCTKILSFDDIRSANPLLKGHENYTSKSSPELDAMKKREANSKALRESGHDISLLSSAFHNMATNSRTGRLSRLSMETVVYRQGSQHRYRPDELGFDWDDWKLIWVSAADTFHVSMRALAASEIPLEELDIFSKLRRCSLGCNELSLVDWDSQGLAESLASLKSLSISISTRPIDEWELDPHPRRRSDPPVEQGVWDYDGWATMKRSRAVVDSEAAEETNFTGLPRMLQLCSHVESLELHYCRLHNLRGDDRPLHEPQHDPFHERVLQRIVADNKLSWPNLKRCRLRGLQVSEDDMVAFLKSTTVRELIMDGVHMLSGTWRSVFDYCSSDITGMQHLYLDALVEHGWRWHVVYSSIDGVPASSNTLDRTEAEARKPILYGVFPNGQFKHTTASRRSNNWLREEYGPP